jgi:hypothetical protein
MSNGVKILDSVTVRLSTPFKHLIDGEWIESQSGYKQSGRGIEMGKEAVDFYCTTKAIVTLLQ